MTPDQGVDSVPKKVPVEKLPSTNPGHCSEHPDVTEFVLDPIREIYVCPREHAVQVGPSDKRYLDGKPVRRVG